MYMEFESNLQANLISLIYMHPIMQFKPAKRFPKFCVVGHLTVITQIAKLASLACLYPVFSHKHSESRADLRSY